MVSLLSTPHGSLNVLLADEDRAALDATAALFAQLGHAVTPYAVSVREAGERIAVEKPDLAVVVVHQDDEHALDLISELTEVAGRPVIALLDDPDAAFLSAAAERGISAFARTDQGEDVQGAIEVAMRRHAETARLTEQVDELEGALERRSLIEMAKGILMERHGVTGREAFALLRDHARQHNRKVVEVARTVVDGHALLPRGDDRRE